MRVYKGRRSNGQRASLAFWVITFALCAYVALCTVQRDNLWGADAWEHHRAILALVGDLWNPGNPTYATDAPSIRYSPYSVVIALIVRATGLDAYDALSLVAVLNTLLLALGVRSFLRSYRRGAAAPETLLVMVSLYGEAPGFANSYALSDLPWHQVNPSAFSFALSVITWSYFNVYIVYLGCKIHLVVICLMSTAATLTHPITGLTLLLGLGVVAVGGPRARLKESLRAAGLVGVVTLLLSAAWPWYDFYAGVSVSRWSIWSAVIASMSLMTAVHFLSSSRLRVGAGATALRRSAIVAAVLVVVVTVIVSGKITTVYDNVEKFGIVKQMYLRWCTPAILLSVCLLPTRTRRLIRVCYIGAALLFSLGLTPFFTGSDFTKHIPLISIFFCHIIIGSFCNQSRLLDPATWPGRVALAANPDWRVCGRPVVEVLVALIFLSCLAPQLVNILKAPHLARPYLAQVLGRPDKQLHLKRRFDRLLAPVGRRDVVLSDPVTSWPVPSSRGRIVAALHVEYSSLLDLGEFRRYSDVARFFSPAPEGERREIVRRYDVGWILLNRLRIDPPVFEDLLEPRAIVARDEELILMDANRWLEQRPHAVQALNYRERPHSMAIAPKIDR